MFDPYSLDITAATHATPSAIAARQSTRWAALLAVAVKGSAFYRDLLGDRDPAETPLQSVPPSDKRALMKRFADWVTDEQVHLPEVRAFIKDTGRIGHLYLDKYLVWESSGSTGEPTVFLQDARSLAVYDALEGLRRHSPRPLQRLFDPMYLGERIAFVGAIDGHFASEASLRRLRRAQPWRAPIWRSFSVLQPVAALIEELEDFAPTILTTYPTAAELLANEVQAGRLHISPHEVWTGGETLTPWMRAHIEEAFGCSLRNSYGASEFLPIAWECSHGRLHVNADWAIVEAVDEHYRPVAPGEASFTTLVTNLANYVQPVIRLDIGDQITLPTARCACGSPLPVIEVQGRCDDVMTLDGVNGSPVSLLPMALSTVLEEDAGVADFQVEQVDGCTLRLRLGRHVPANAAATCRGALRAFADAQGVAPLRVLVTPPAELPLGRSGKLRRIRARPKSSPPAT